MNKTIPTLWALTGILQPFVTIAIAVFVTRWLTLWLGWRWYWQYIAAIIIAGTINWALDLLINELGQQMMRSQP